MTRETPMILIADDAADIRDLVSYRLEKAGYEVAVAADGREALDKAKELKPDLAVLDGTMPFLDGYEVTAGIRKDRSLAAMPVIMLLARTHEQDVERGFEVGADDYIKKPFSLHELRARVQAILGGR